VEALGRLVHTAKLVELSEVDDDVDLVYRSLETDEDVRTPGQQRRPFSPF
jgi:hypothetical protein